MEPNRVKALRGWGWIVDSYRLFQKNPLIWLSLVFIFWMLLMVSNLVQVVGPMLMTLLTPAFLAGLMLGCRALEQDKELEIAYVFAGFKQNVGNLITLGGINLTATVLIIGMSSFFDGGTFLKMVFFGEMPPGTKDAANLALGPGTELAVLFTAALSLPLMMAYWFSPSLIVFHGMPAVQAMKSSFYACLRNFMPFFVYSLALTAIMLGGMMLLGMVMGLLGAIFGQTNILLAALLAVILFPLLLVFLSIMIGTIYTSYRDIFSWEENVEG